MNSNNGRINRRGRELRHSVCELATVPSSSTNSPNAVVVQIHENPLNGIEAPGHAGIDASRIRRPPAQVRTPAVALPSSSTGDVGSRSSVHKRIKEFFDNNQLCDVTIICDDRRVDAHRVILAGSSDYFEAMFTGSLHEAEQKEVIIRGMDPDALESLIRYCYTGELEPLQETSVEALLSGACVLQLTDVVQACSDFLAQQLHPSNCLGIRAFADAQGCHVLLERAAQFTMYNFNDVASNHEFLLLPIEDVIRLVESDDLNIPSEEDAFHAAVLWLNYDSANRKRFASALLSTLRLPLLSPTFIADHVEGNHLFRDDPLCKNLILEAFKYHALPAGHPSVSQEIPRPRKSTIGVIYAVGGQDSNKGVMTIEKYCCLEDNWCLVGQLPGRRLQVGVAVMDNKVHIVGGRDGLKTLNNCDCWDPKTNTWSQMDPMNVPRHGLGVAVLEGPLYAIGGHDGWSYLSTVERYDPGSNTWTYVAEMSAPRSTLGVVVLGGRLYAIGGRDGSQCLRTVESYNPHTNKWSLCGSMCKRRGGVGVAVLNGYIYAVGGLEAPTCNPSATRFDCVERYDPGTGQWSIITKVSFGRDGIGVCTLGSYLFCVGGYSGNNQYSQTVECYDPARDEWKKSSDLCSGRAGSCVVALPSAVMTKSSRRKTVSASENA